MLRRLVAIVTASLLSCSLMSGQIKSWSSYGDYCRDNPHAPTCVNGKPLKVDGGALVIAMQGMGYCLKNPQPSGCADYCRKNPKALPCLDVKSLTSQPTRSSSGSTNSRPEVRTSSTPAASGPTIVDIPAPPPERNVAAHGKLLGLPADWRFAHPHPDLLVGINAASLRQSATLRALLTQLAAALQVKPADLDATLAQTVDVDQYWISFHSGDALLLLQGRMNAPAGPTALNNGSTVYRISNNAVLVGRTASVNSAVLRVKQGAALTAGNARQMKEMGAGSDVWLMGTPVMLAQARNSTLGKSALASDVSSYLLGFNFRDGFNADLKLNYATQAAARRAFDFIKDAGPPPDPAIQMSSDMAGNAVRLRFTVDQSKLSAAFNKVLAAPAIKPWLTMASHSIKSSNEMVIYGLPGGPKEIPSTPNTAPPGKMVIYGLPGGPKEM